MNNDCITLYAAVDDGNDKAMYGMCSFIHCGV